MNARTCGCVEQPCGCCVGVQQLTPASECNRPGLGAISYRVGTHGQFLETMKARLSTMEVDGVGTDGQTVGTFRPLLGLTARDSSDPSIALLDGWATVGDVLSFYQERIANEGYLRTATERRSVLELSNLVGYTLRPGVASTVYLAYTIDENQVDPVTIPLRARSQSIPGPDELPQSFETSDPLEARSAWNNFKPRISRAQTAATVFKVNGDWRVYLKGINTNLKLNDALLIDHGDGKPNLYRVLTVVPGPKLDQTLVTFSDWLASSVKASPPVSTPAAPAARDTGSSVSESANADMKVDPAIAILQKLSLAPSIPPRSTLTVMRDLQATFTAQADIASQVVTTFQPALQKTFSAAIANAPVGGNNLIRVYALRAKARLFGSNLPGQPNYQKDDTGMISVLSYTGPTLANTFGDSDPAPLATVALDAEYERIQTTGWAAIERPHLNPFPVIGVPAAGEVGTSGPIVTIHAVTDARTSTLAAFGVATKSTQLTVDRPWLSELGEGDLSGTWSSSPLLRGTSVYAQSEELALANEPIVDDICKGASTWIELDGLYSDLKSGRWVIVSGERADVMVPDPNGTATLVPVSGVSASELVMLSNVIQDVTLSDGDHTPSSQYHAPPPVTLAFVPLPPPPLSNETKHTFIQFAKDLQYCYARDTVKIYGNVVKATHGETRNETLGNGDGAKGLQSFTLKQPPLTFVPAPTPVGADSTLHAYVNNVEWRETDSLAWLGPKDRRFVTRTDDRGNTTLTFGNGKRGARLPTGSMNVTAVYRNGIGNGGNVRAEQISLLQTRPLGVQEVINPMRASGGADKEGRDLARENAPLSVMPLDRLVSVRDYADFTRRFAGIAKALAIKTSDGQRELVYLTIAGVDDAPIDESSDLYRNLLEALHDLGDPDLPLRVDLRELKMLVLSANIKLQVDYQWEPVVTAVRAQLLDTFGFGKRALGQPVLLSEVISAIQNVGGVAYVDVDALGAIPEKIADTAADGTVTRRPLTPLEVSGQVQFVVDPSAVLKIALSPAARDRLPGNVSVWTGGSDMGALHPAELAIFAPAIPDTLILNQIL